MDATSREGLDILKDSMQRMWAKYEETSDKNMLLMYNCFQAFIPTVEGQIKRGEDITPSQLQMFKSMANAIMPDDVWYDL